MHGDLRHTFAPGQFEHREDVVLVAVHATGGEQAHEMERAVDRLRGGTGGAQFGIGEEAAVLDGRIDAGEVLVDDPAGAEVHVPDFGVAHLPVRQADEAALGVDQRMRVASQQGVPVRQRRLREGIVGRVFAVAPAVEDEQYDGLGTRIRRHEGLPVTSGRGKL